MGEKYKLGCGDTVHMPHPGQKIPHLWIIVADPDSNGNAVMVNVTTQVDGSDTTVILRKGDHPYILHDSVIYFADAHFVELENLECGIEAKLCHQCDPCSEELLARIQKGMLESKFTPNKIKKHCCGLWNA